MWRSASGFALVADPPLTARKVDLYVHKLQETPLVPVPTVLGNSDSPINCSVAPACWQSIRLATQPLFEYGWRWMCLLRDHLALYNAAAGCRMPPAGS